MRETKPFMRGLNFRRWAADAVGKYIMKLDGLSSHVLTRKYAISKWIPPIDPFIRINFNPAFDPKEYRSGSGVVIRDDRGDVISQNQHCMGVVSPFAVEALVCS